MPTTPARDVARGREVTNFSLARLVESLLRWWFRAVSRSFGARGVQQMRHPFDGISPAKRKATRRSWLRGLFAAVAGLFAVRAAEAVAPPVGLTLKPEPSPEPGSLSTKMTGEEGGPRPVTRGLAEAGG